MIIQPQSTKAEKINQTNSDREESEADLKERLWAMVKESSSPENGRDRLDPSVAEFIRAAEEIHNRMWEAADKEREEQRKFLEFMRAWADRFVGSWKAEKPASQTAEVTNS